MASTSNKRPRLQQPSMTDFTADAKNALSLVDELTTEFNSLPDDEKPFVAFSKAVYLGDVAHVDVVFKYYSKLCDDSKSCVSEKCLLCSFRNGDIKMVKFLHKYGIGNVVSEFYGDCFSFTPLMFACERNHYSIVELLIKCGAQVHRQDENLLTPLMISCRLGHEKIVEILVQHLDLERIDSSNADNMTAMAYACRYGYLGIVKTLLQHGASVNYTIGRREESLLVYSSAYSNDNQSKVVKLLLKNGSDVNAATVDGDTALLRSISRKNEEVVRTLLRHGVDINATDDTGNTAFSLAMEMYATTNNKRFMGLLCKYGPPNNLDVKDKNGRTAFMHASMKMDDDVLGCLLDKGANIDAQDNKGNTAIMLVSETDFQMLDCVYWLIDAGADLDIKNNSGNTVFTITLEATDGDSDNDCLEALLDSGKLLDKESGMLKSVHKNAIPSSSMPLNINNTLMMMDYGIFKWAWSQYDGYWNELNKEHLTESMLRICKAALNKGFCPGKLLYKKFKISPLVLSFVCQDLYLAQEFISQLYFYPEDYNLLTCSSTKIKKYFSYRVRNSKTLRSLTCRPLSLMQWSVLNISKAISLAGPASKRKQRVCLLPIPEVLKSKLLFKN